MVQAIWNLMNYISPSKNLAATSSHQNQDSPSNQNHESANLDPQENSGIPQQSSAPISTPSGTPSRIEQENPFDKDSLDIMNDSPSLFGTSSEITNSLQQSRANVHESHVTTERPEPQFLQRERKRIPASEMRRSNAIDFSSSSIIHSPPPVAATSQDDDDCQVLTHSQRQRQNASIIEVSPSYTRKESDTSHTGIGKHISTTQQTVDLANTVDDDSSLSESSSVTHSRNRKFSRSHEKAHLNHKRKKKMEALVRRRELKRNLQQKNKKMPSFKPKASEDSPTVIVQVSTSDSNANSSRKRKRKSTTVPRKKKRKLGTDSFETMRKKQEMKNFIASPQSDSEEIDQLVKTPRQRYAVDEFIEECDHDADAISMEDSYHESQRGSSLDDDLHGENTSSALVHDLEESSDIQLVHEDPMDTTSISGRNRDTRSNHTPIDLMSPTPTHVSEARIMYAQQTIAQKLHAPGLSNKPHTFKHNISVYIRYLVAALHPTQGKRFQKYSEKVEKSNQPFFGDAIRAVESKIHEMMEHLSSSWSPGLKKILQTHRQFKVRESSGFVESCKACSMSHKSKDFTVTFFSRGWHCKLIFPPDYIVNPTPAHKQQSEEQSSMVYHFGSRCVGLVLLYHAFAHLKSYATFLADQEWKEFSVRENDTDAQPILMIASSVCNKVYSIFVKLESLFEGNIKSEKVTWKHIQSVVRNMHSLVAEEVEENDALRQNLGIRQVHDLVNQPDSLENTPAIKKKTQKQKKQHASLFRMDNEQRKYHLGASNHDIPSFGKDRSISTMQSLPTQNSHKNGKSASQGSYDFDDLPTNSIKNSIDLVEQEKAGKRMEIKDSPPRNKHDASKTVLCVSDEENPPAVSREQNEEADGEPLLNEVL